MKNKGKKRIIAISNFADFLGGGEHSFFELIEGLKDSWEIIALVPEEGEVKRKLEDIGLEVLVARMSQIRPWKVKIILHDLVRLYSIINSKTPSLIYTNGPRSTLYSGFIGTMRKIPVLWHCRISDSDKYLDFINTRLSRGIISNSKATAARFKSNIQSKVNVVYNGIDLERLHLDDCERPSIVRDDWRIILTVARVSRMKRHDLVLSAFEAVAESDKDVHMVFVGGCDKSELDWWDHLQKRTKGSKFSDRIHWIGAVSDVRPWYKAATVMVLASKNEAFGRVIVEAMGCGVPVVAMKDGGVPEIVRNWKDGILIDIGLECVLADSIKKIVSDEDLRISLSASAFERSKKFDLDTHIRKMDELFRSYTYEKRPWQTLSNNIDFD
ncbi:MAG: glycosyltransferase family 4 protein [Bacteroidetes bacterium]|nr:glycosyltransferase family 4 protein [Bacteroidota bacterium]